MRTCEEEVGVPDACVGRRRHLRPLLVAGPDTVVRSGGLVKFRRGEVYFGSRLIFIKAENSKTARPRLGATTRSLYEELLRLWRGSGGEVGARVFGATDNFKKGFAAACGVVVIGGQPPRCQAHGRNRVPGGPRGLGRFGVGFARVGRGTYYSS